MTRKELYNLSKTIFNPDEFSFDDTLQEVHVKVPINPSDVNELLTFVYKLLSNTIKPQQVDKVPLKIMGDYIDHDDTLMVNRYGELSVKKLESSDSDSDSSSDDENEEYIKSIKFSLKDNSIAISAMLLPTEKEAEHKIIFNDEDFTVNTFEQNGKLTSTITTKKDSLQDSQILELKSEVAELKTYIDEQISSCVKA